MAVVQPAGFFATVAKGVPPAVLAQDQPALRNADRFGVHDLVRGALFQDAVLVDARLVGEGIASHNRLVGLGTE